MQAVSKRSSAGNSRALWSRCCRAFGCKFVLALAFGGLLSCQKGPPASDARLIQELVGTWITDQSGAGYRLYAENSFHRDGFHSADQILHQAGGTTKWSYTGTWDVKNGKLVASGEVIRSDSAQVQSYQVEEAIESLTADELVLIDSKGTKLIHHRRPGQ